VRKLLLVIPLLLLGILFLSCGGGNGNTTTNTNASTTTSTPDYTATEATTKTSNIDITATTPINTNTSSSKPVKNVSVMVEKNKVSVGETFEVVIVVDIMEAMSRGATCGLSWTPSSLVECTEASDGDFFGKFSPVDIGASGLKAVHNDQGIVERMAQFCTGEPIDKGATGKGVLYVFKFTAKNKGQVTFSIPDTENNNCIISDVTAENAIVPEAVNPATITIQ
jgi:hypothetical protein